MADWAGKLYDIARADLSHTAAMSAFLAVSFHLVIQSVEFEDFMFHFLAVCTVLWPMLLGFFIHYGQYHPTAAVAKSAVVATTFQGCLLLSIAVYRLGFHRCSKFPGPIGARVSRFYATYLSLKNVQYYRELEKMHTKYGDFVRTGPREITILRQSAVDIIYGPKSQCRKSTWYGQTGNDPLKSSLHMTRDHESHRLRRKAWDKSMSVKGNIIALASYEPRIMSGVNALVAQLKQRGEDGVNMTDWSMFFSFDLMGQVGFGKDFGQLHTGQEHSAIRPIHAHIKTLGIFQTVPWLLYLMSAIPGAAAAYSEIFDFCANEIRTKQQTWNKEKDPSDIASWLIKAVQEKDVSAAPSPQAIEDDARIILLAGSDTTATTLSHCLFLVVKYPHEQKKLQALLDATMPGGADDWTFEKVKSIKYLDDFISETLRVKAALTLAGPRETPAGGLQIDEVHIPGGVNVLVPAGQIHRDPRYWKQADEFIPERWGERREEMGTDGAPYLPFLLGRCQLGRLDCIDRV
ncbi:hypothetical protein PFICI_08409 [Pestalotiopsis fici W106-1]|uniref:Uncharacterized protein n=1 Tax=Pestalotiopsis fici (strain W106-1 / CGMCC3.15140) TaxID=1229662 RepID=W3X494_PESFW|nr:uncharacterized protein PFICI_08409 [Pestalotiopsis fici W106-1]ETS80880.1 hypothetical protein PFICI_08409 [Pestalotiopsis fici W106-1]